MIRLLRTYIKPATIKYVILSMTIMNDVVKNVQVVIKEQVCEDLNKSIQNV